jgi:DtxR family manganese transport transcriptional regulator
MSRIKGKGRPRPRARQIPRAVRAQADGYRRLRDQHAREAAQDYVELIADLIREQGEARAVDLARRLGVTQATVTRGVARLQRKGFLRTAPYRSIFLTAAGRGLAQEARRRHQIVAAFLRALGVSDLTAWHDAEGMEHHVSQETLKAFERFARARGNGAGKARG